jgi:hypothetical protein
MCADLQFLIFALLLVVASYSGFFISPAAAPARVTNPRVIRTYATQRLGPAPSSDTSSYPVCVLAPSCSLHRACSIVFAFVRANYLLTCSPMVHR